MTLLQTVYPDPYAFKPERFLLDGKLNPDMAFHPIINELVSWPKAYDSMAFSFHPNAEGHRIYARAFKEALASKRNAVIELAADLPDGPAAVERRPLHELGARFAFHADDVRHLVWSNSVDARRPGSVRWWLVDRAVAAGASPGGATRGCTS